MNSWHTDITRNGRYHERRNVGSPQANALIDTDRRPEAAQDLGRQLFSDIAILSAGNNMSILTCWLWWASSTLKSEIRHVIRYKPAHIRFESSARVEPEPRAPSITQLYLPLSWTQPHRPKHEPTMKQSPLATLIVALFLALAISHVCSQNPSLNDLVTNITYVQQLVNNPGDGNAATNWTNTLSQITRALQSGDELSQENIDALSTSLSQLLQRNPLPSFLLSVVNQFLPSLSGLGTKWKL